MKKGRKISTIKDHAKKRQRLETDIENLHRQNPTLNNTHILKPDKETQRAITQASYERYQEEMRAAQDRLSQHMDEIRALQQQHEKNELSGEQEQADRQTLTYHEWVYDPDDMRSTNVLANNQSGDKVAMIQRSDHSRTLDDSRANAQLLLVNDEYDRWQDAGVHHYEDALHFAENYAYEHEIEIDHGDIGHDPGMDYDQEL